MFRRCSQGFSPPLFAKAFHPIPGSPLSRRPWPQQSGSVYQSIACAPAQFLCRIVRHHLFIYPWTITMLVLTHKPVACGPREHPSLQLVPWAAAVRRGAKLAPNKPRLWTGLAPPAVPVNRPPLCELYGNCRWHRTVTMFCQWSVCCVILRGQKLRINGPAGAGDQSGLCFESSQ